MLSSQELTRHLEHRLPDFKPLGLPDLLQGGLVNYVWRMNGHPSSVVVKAAPPFVASAPDIALDPKRIITEGRIMAAFTSGGPLEDLADEYIRPPRIIDLDEEAGILVMEDLGDSLDLGNWLYQDRQPPGLASEYGRKLGQFIGRLHARTCADPTVAAAFDNPGIQHIRLESQYRHVTGYCRRSGLTDAQVLGRQAVAFGRLLRQPGLCAIMGDLWPRSILVTGRGLRMIDWEFAHYGRPAQDIGHLAAHLWMHRQCAPNEQAAAKAQAALDGFLEAYRSALGSNLAAVVGSSGERECAIHFGSEVLARTVGIFQHGYLYEGFALEDEKIEEAVEIAAVHLRPTEAVETFALLRVES